MITLALPLALPTLGAVLWGTHNATNSKSADRAARLLAFLLPVAAVVALELLILQVLNAPAQDWNARRLVGPMGLAHGLPLYYGPHEGPMISGLNGPIFTLSFFPAAFGSTPTAAMLIGSLLAGLYFFLPIGWLCFSVGKNRALSLAAFLCFCLLSVTMPPLKMSAFLIHADAPALGLGALACLVLAVRRFTETSRLLLCALLCALALFSKVTLLPLIFAIAFYLILLSGFRTALKYLVFVLAITAGCFLFFGLFFGFEAMSYSLWASNTAAPWISSLTNPAAPFAVGFAARFRILLAIAFTLLQSYYFFPIVILSNLFLSLAHYREQSTGFKDALSKCFRENPSTLFLLASVCLLPSSCAGRAKAGGVENTLSPTLYFLIAAFVSLFVENGGRPEIARACKLVTGVVLTFVTAVALPVFYSGTWGLKALRTNSNETAFEFAKKHPGTTYFPDFPLSNLMADGKIYHSGTGVMELELGKFKIGDAQFRAFTPKNLEVVAFNSPPPHVIMKYLPEFKLATADPELAGWSVYRRN